MSFHWKTRWFSELKIIHFCALTAIDCPPHSFPPSLPPSLSRSPRSLFRFALTHLSRARACSRARALSRMAPLGFSFLHNHGATLLLFTGPSQVEWSRGIDLDHLSRGIDLDHLSRGIDLDHLYGPGASTSIISPGFTCGGITTISLRLPQCTEQR